jgi:acetyl-CoA synthetase
MKTIPSSTEESLSSLSTESRLFAPSAEFRKSASIKSVEEYEELYARFLTQPIEFWRTMAENELEWDQSFSEVLNWNPPDAKWFDGGKLNASVQCLDRFKQTSTWNKPALIWEGEDGSVRNFSYSQLSALVSQTANGLKSLGAKKGDIIMVYLPMIPEAVATLLACARIGAAHSVVFGGFSREALKDRINDAQAKFLVTSDGGFRRGQAMPLKQAVDDAAKSAPTLEKILVVRRTDQHVDMKSGRDFWWHDVIDNQSDVCEPVSVDSEHLLFTLYTSGTTGKPKGIMHTTAGYMLWAKLTTKWVFDLHEQDVYWCTADIGWVTGHSYIIYGPLQNGATVVMYEGAPQFPDWGRFWQIIQRHKVTVFYTAPTAIRALMGQGNDIPAKYDLSSLRILGTVGEPINPEAWMWYHKFIGHEKCPIVDTWWQTETGGIMVSPIPGAISTKPGSCTRPLPGVDIHVVRKDKSECKPNEGGYLVITQPWPGMLRGIYGDPERFKKTYWNDFGDYYFSGDGARKDSDGYFWVMGRVDDVINVSGHRLGTAEIESALVSHESVVEAAVVGRPDPLKGQAVVAFVTLSKEASERLRSQDADFAASTNGLSMIKNLRDHVVKEIGALARPEEIKIVAALPKTRSGKIMRRLLREIATSGKATGDTTTLEDANILTSLMDPARSDEE